MSDPLSPEAVTALFTRTSGDYTFARWGRPLAPIVFGIEDQSLSVIKGAIEAVAQLAGLEVVQTDPELGANLMVFFFREWAELPEVPDLDRMIPDLKPLTERLESVGANQYRIFRFDDAGAIRACFVFLRMDKELSAVPAETLALSQVVQSILLWSDSAFSGSSPLARIPETDMTILRPEIGALIRAAYDPVMPAAAQDPAHALRLYARLGLVQ